MPLELLPGPRLDVAHLLQLHGVADPGHHVLALGVDQVVAVGGRLAVGRVAGEGDPGARIVALVAEHHGLDVDGRAERVVDLVLAPVVDGPLVVPGAEHGLDAAGELRPRVLGELLAGLRGDDALELLDQRLEIALVQLDVVADALGLLGVLQRLLEAVAVHAHDRLAVHLQQPPVGVPREPLRAGLLGQALDALVIQAQVQHRVHHPRHRERGARADRDQQRVAGVAQAAAHPLLELLQVAGDLLQHAVGELAPGRPVGVAGLTGHREPQRDGQAHVGHLGQVGPLPAQQVLHVLVALLEVVHELVGHGATSDLLPSPSPVEVHPAWRRIVAASQSWPSASRSRVQVSPAPKWTATPLIPG